MNIPKGWLRGAVYREASDEALLLYGRRLKQIPKHQQQALLEKVLDNLIAALLYLHEANLYFRRSTM
jgi:hypothetical protein